MVFSDEPSALLRSTSSAPSRYFEMTACAPARPPPPPEPPDPPDPFPAPSRSLIPRNLHHRLDLLGTGSRRALPCCRGSLPLPIERFSWISRRLCVREASPHHRSPESTVTPLLHEQSPVNLPLPRCSPLIQWLHPSSASKTHHSTTGFQLPSSLDKLFGSPEKISDYRRPHSPSSNHRVDVSVKMGHDDDGEIMGLPRPFSMQGLWLPSLTRPFSMPSKPILWYAFVVGIFTNLNTANASSRMVYFATSLLIWKNKKSAPTSLLIWKYKKQAPTSSIVGEKSIALSPSIGERTFSPSSLSLRRA